MTGYENHAGFTIYDTKLQIVEVGSQDKQFLLENIAESYFNEPINFEKDKETKVSALLQGAFNELILKKPLKCSAVSFTLPFELFYTAQLPFDNTLLHQDLVEEFRWELSILHPYISTRDFVIQYIEIDKNEFVPLNTAVVVAIQRKYLQILNNFCNQNNLKLKFVDNVHFASEKALFVSDPLTVTGLVMSVYLDNKHFSIIFSYNGKPIYFTSSQLKDASEIPGLIVKAITQRDGFNINKNSISASFITGDNLSISLVQTLRDTLDIDFIQFNPFEKIKPRQQLIDNKLFSEQYNSFASAAGIAFRVA
ncbi:MAG TPA: hypothetical protein VKA26_15020 [Ignavibacteriaceae bacterium]|nr:hypothetical protein [Ignavibacteriaceae bacterium]